MQYRTAARIEEKLSLMGYGYMRATRKLGGSIDQDKAERELSAAIDRGVNYFDTAYTYGPSEASLGAFMAKGHREHMYVATKLPHYQCKSAADFDRIFDEQLARLKTDYIDFYLMHMLTSVDSWKRVVDMGIEDWIARKKESGAIRHIGFSYHGGKDDFKQLVDIYPWELVQIQLNYLDAHAQAGLEGLEYAGKAGLPVIIMEPLRGGRLVSKLPHDVVRTFEKAQSPDTMHTPAEWGLAWLFNLPQVTCVLSGMNSLAQVEENCALASRVATGSLVPEQLAVYDEVVARMQASESIGCTGCNYCMPCPFGVDIPTCFRSYNTRMTEGMYAGLSEYFMCTSLKKEPSNAGLCRECGRCEGKCPQSIPIRADLKKVQRSLEGPIYKIAAKFKSVRWRV